MRILQLLGFCVATFVCAEAAQAQQNDALVGHWKMLSSTDNGDEIPWNLSISYGDGKYSATASIESGENPVKDLKVEGKTIHFRVPYQGNDYEIDLKLVGEKLKGTWSGNGDSGDTKGEKAVAEKTSALMLPANPIAANYSAKSITRPWDLLSSRMPISLAT